MESSQWLITALFTFLTNPLVSSQQTTCPVSASIQYQTYTQAVSAKNNKFGLYIYAEREDFFELAQNLVNTNGGDWGYVLIPYNVKDRDFTKWRGVFERLNNKHLIPVIQLWDVDTKNYKEQTKEAAQFLNSFMWPIKQRYVSVYNEPNDANFWGGEVVPEQYARILNYTIDTFKKENPSFFMLNGALNVSASTTATQMDAFDYMALMNKEVPYIFNKLDGWATHSYPQPNFSGSVYTQGRWGIKAYDAELDYLKQALGLDKNLPVFITETGWAHAEGTQYNSSFLPVNLVAQNFVEAYEEIWLKDDRVVAVMPFTIWYEPPFDHFSWINSDTVPYAHYHAIRELKKERGIPQHLILKEEVVLSCIGTLN